MLEDKQQAIIKELTIFLDQLYDKSDTEAPDWVQILINGDWSQYEALIDLAYKHLKAEEKSQ